MSKIKKFLKCLNIRFVLYFSLAAIMLLVGEASMSAFDTKGWTEKFNTSACTWSSTGKNDYFVLEPGYQETLEGREEGASTVLVITVLPDTRQIGNIETRIVEERESKNGQLVEVSRNFFAVCGPSNDVFYFGEDVDMYKNGKVDSHEGSWVAETGGAKPGLFMPANPHLGDRFYQEVAPKVAMDRVEIVSVSESLKTPAGEFHDCVKTEETTPIEPGAKEYKVFAKGVGIIQDGDLLLSKYGSAVSK
jgi:hypothetical protein